MRGVAWAVASTLVVTLVAGCAAPVTPLDEAAFASALESLARVELDRPLATGAPDTLRGQGGVDIRSDRLEGAFHAAVAARRGAHPSVRLQLFPDVGGKLLDLVATPDRLSGTMAQGGGGEVGGLDVDPRDGVDEPHLLVMLAVTLAEVTSRVPPERVLSIGSRGDGQRVTLVPALPLRDLRVAVVSGADGAWTREYAWGLVRWSDRREGDDVIVEARDFELRAKLDLQSLGEALPDALFAPLTP